MNHFHHWGLHTGSSLAIAVILCIAVIVGLGDDGRRLLGVVALLLLISFMCGCADVRPRDAAEVSFQVLNVVDAGQTATIAREPGRWREADPVTSIIIGAHPTEAHVYEAMAAYGLAHYAVYRWLDHEDDEHPGQGWGTALGIWEGLTITGKGFVIGKNFSWGIQPWGAHHD